MAACFGLLAACSRDIENTNAVRQGVIDHLSGRSGLDVSSMQVEVTKVSFRKDEADATVSFRPKGSADPSSGMEMRYTLERKGGRWVVKGKADMGGHGEGGSGGAAMPGMPPGHPPAGSAPAASPTPTGAAK